jgi:hypothetical protein
VIKNLMGVSTRALQKKNLIDENLSNNVNKTKHPKKGERKVQDGRTQV